MKARPRIRDTVKRLDAALAMVRQEPPEECLKNVVRHHASDVSPGLWSEITGLLPAVR